MWFSVSIYCSILSQAVNEGALSKPNISDTPIQHVQAFPTTGNSEACQTHLAV